MMKKLMILGASILQIPAIIKAKQMGFKTIVVDMNKNAVGFQYADICVPISTIDIPNILEAAKQHKIDGIMTLASDMPVNAVAVVSQVLNLIGIKEDTALKATNKAIMRKCLQENDVPVPRFFCVTDYSDYVIATQQFEKRLIVKPADNSGSRGVFLVENIEQIDFAFEYSKTFSKTGQIIVEEYMEGPEVSVESLTVNGVTNIIAITDKITSGAPNFVEMGHSQPTRHPGNIQEKIEKIAKAAIKAIGIENGPAHTEIIITEEGPKIVELGARLGGDNITTYLVPLSTGIDIVECSIRIALGLKPDFNPKYNKGSAIRYFQSKQGRLEAISNIEKAVTLPGVKQVTFTKEVGEYIPNINNSNDRIGFVIAQADTNEDAIKICENAIEIINIEINSGETNENTAFKRLLRTGSGC